MRKTETYYVAEMTYDKGFKQYHDVETLDEALLYVRKNHEINIPFTDDDFLLEHAVIWKIKPEKVYEFKKNTE